MTAWIDIVTPWSDNAPGFWKNFYKFNSSLKKKYPDWRDNINEELKQHNARVLQTRHGGSILAFASSEELTYFLMVWNARTE